MSGSNSSIVGAPNAATGVNALMMPGIGTGSTTNPLAPTATPAQQPFQFDPVAAQQWIAQQMQQQANFPATAPGTFTDQAGLRGMLEQLGGGQTAATPSQTTAAQATQASQPLQTTSPLLNAYGPAMATLAQLGGVPIGGVQNYPGAASGQGLTQWFGQQFGQGANPGGGPGGDAQGAGGMGY